VQNPDDLPASQSETPSVPTGLKGKLKSCFNLKSLKGFPTTAFKNIKHEFKTRKLEMLAGVLTSGIIKGGAATVCTASLLGSVSGIIMMGAATGALVAAAKYGVSYKKASEEERKNFSLKQLGVKMAFGATFGILGNTVGTAIAHQLHCFGGKLFDGKSFITTHKSNLVPGFEGQASHAAPSVLHNTPPVAEMAGAQPVPHAVPATPAPDVVASAPAAPGVTATPSPSVPDTVVSTAPAPVPVPVAPATPLDAIKDYAANHKVSAKLKEALVRADSTNPRIRAQALDDIAVYAPKDLRVEAYELLKKSATMGNVKAKTDLAEMLFNGDKTIGLKADPDAAITKMTALAKHSPRASKILESWIGNPPPESVRELVRQAHAAAANTPIPVTPSSDVVTVDVTTPSVPVQVEVPAIEPVAEVGAPITEPAVTSVPLADRTPIVPAVKTPATVKVAPDCKGIVDIFSNAIRFICKVGADDTTFEIGDRVVIQRPALIVPGR
jgi:hypothetical protein